jgi:hypothetical protein
MPFEKRMVGAYKPPDMADLMPVNQVATMEDGQSRKVFERRSDKIIIFSHSADGWIWITAWQDRVAKDSAPLSFWERGGG